MEKRDTFLLSLGLAKKAGALCAGQKAVLDSLRRGEAGLVFAASDACGATKKKLTTSCAHYRVELRDAGHTMDELAAAIGVLSETAAVSVKRSSVLHLFKPRKTQ